MGTKVLNIQYYLNNAINDVVAYALKKWMKWSEWNEMKGVIENAIANE